MTYVLFGPDSERINIYLESFVKKFFNNEENNVIKFNALDSTVDEALNECYQLDLAFNKKIVVIDNATYLAPKQKYSKNKDSKIFKKNDYKSLIEYIKNNENEEVLLIFIVYNENIDLENEIISAIPNANRKFLMPIKDEEWPLYIKTYFSKNKLDIENNAINEIIKRTKGNLRYFLNESKKLLIYCDKKVHLKDVLELFIKPQEEDIFELTKNLISGDKEKALTIYKDLRLTQNIEPISLISIMANNLFFLDQVLYLKNKNLNMEEIANLLKVKKGKIYFAFQDLKNIKQDKIKKALEDLYNLDKKIKHNEVDRFYNFELFILNF